MGAITVRCEKCGHQDTGPEGKCTQCGEFLYPFYLRQRRKRLMVRAGIGVVAAGLVCGTLLIAHLRTRDPLRDDLIKYFRQIESANLFLNDRVPVAMEANYGDYAEKLLKVSARRPPTERVEKKLFDEFRMFSTADLYSLKHKAYLRVTPINPEVKRLHGYLLAAFKAASEGYECFTNGMKVKAIFNVSFEDDGTIRWSENRYRPEFADCFKGQHKIFNDNYEEYIKEAMPLVEVKKLGDGYSKAFPGELEVKYIITNYVSEALQDRKQKEEL